jgi:ATP-dependent DNA helicase RecG
LDNEQYHDDNGTNRKFDVVELVGRKNILSRQYYEFIDKRGVYTRKKGLDRETNKQLLLKHIQENKKQGSRLQELMDVLPTLSRNQIQKLLFEMKKEKMIHLVGKTRSAKWYPGSSKE